MSLKDWPKGLLIGFSALVISTLGIQASDEFRGISSSMSGALGNSGDHCSTNEVLVVVEGKALCFDVYEASPNDECLYANPASGQETIFNIAKSNCLAESKAAVLPWRFVTYTQAQQLCARSGKRLPTNNEWYKNALSVVDPDLCFSANLLQLTGVNNCLTQNGISDLVGNVWEWMEDVVTDGSYAGRALPDSGYVGLVDSAGIVLETKTEPDPAFASDYAWITQGGTRGILRGGFYGSGSDGGIFSQNITTPLDFAATGVGFRCVRDLI